MTPELGAGIVRFRSRRTGEIAGHGVLVDDEHVATCAHVINVALGRDLQSSASAVGEVVRLEFPLLAQLTAAPPERHARVDSWARPGTSFEGVDVAGLTLVSEPRPTGAAPIPLASEHRIAGDVLLYGTVVGRPGGWVAARLRPLVAPHRQQIEQLAHDAFAARPGFSGTPVVDAATGHVLGLLVATAADQDSNDVYAIPLPSVVASWPEAFAPTPPTPYKGLRAFESADQDLFFGRASVVQELLCVVGTRALVPVVGASGVGKSSVVHAGLLPRLEQQQARWGFVTIRPRPTLLTALAAGFARLCGSDVPVPVADLEAWQERLSNLAGAAELACAGSAKERVLVIVDQFEEVLSQDCDLLLQQLADLPDDGLLTVVLTLREDSFGTFFVRHASFGERLRLSAVALRGMDAAELAEIIREPAALRGVRISDRLAGELVGAVRDRPGALPLLEFSLDQMWRTIRAEQPLLSFDAYEEIGRLDGALAAHADKILDGLNETEQALVRNLFVKHLASSSHPDVRQVLKRSECTPIDWQIIVRLANERLLTISRDDDGNETAEVVHEALLRGWDQLRSWLDAERPFRSWRQLLQDAMTPWSETGENGTLLTGALLVTSERWLHERAADLDLDERRFIEMSLIRREEEEHRYQVLYRRSFARTLSHTVEATQDPVLALLLAIEVVERSPDAQADRLLRACLGRLRAEEITSIPEETDAGALHRPSMRLTLSDWSRGPGANGHWLLGDSTVGLVIDGRGQVQHGAGAVIPMPGPVVVAACTLPGMACLATEAGELALWQLADRPEKVSSRDLRVPIACVAVSETGQTLAAACDDGVIRVLNGEDLSDVGHLPLPGFTRDIDLSTDRLAAALSYNRRIHVWDLVSRTPICESITGIDADILAIDSSEDYIIVGDAVIGSGVRRFPFSARALTAWARQIAGRELTEAERRRYIDDPSI
jgi:hypothetical protein